MPTSIAADLDRRKRKPGRPKGPSPEGPLQSFAADLLADIRHELSITARVRFPSPLYRNDPVRFFREVLGVEPWHKQVEVMEAIRDHSRVAVVSGHKVSKSHTAAGIALWYYCSFDDARVIMTSTTARQVDQILWRELRMMRARSGRCVGCKLADPSGLIIRAPCPHSTLIEGDLGEMARTGLKSPDFREVVGFTAREAEAVAGISGRNLLYLVDEASGVEQIIFDAIEGNRAGGARLIMFSNGTRNEGEFYDAFHAKQRFYKTITISSEETPNVVEGREVIPGLASREWVEEKKEEWGEESALYQVRVKGRFATQEERKIFTLHMIQQAEQRWHVTLPAGRLFVGVDPAGESGTGDETAVNARRGLKQLELRRRIGLSVDAHIVLILSMLLDHKLPRETPVVVVDRGGPIGAELAGRLRAYLESNAGAFELVTVMASDKAVRQPQVYDRLRDELAANLKIWLRDGGGIVEDTKLAKELHVLEFRTAINGKLKLIPKTEIRKLIGRSPDSYDALSLSVWEPLSLHAENDNAAPAPATPEQLGGYAESTFDPYAGR